MTSSIMDELLYNIFCEGIRPSEHPDAANFSDEVKRKMDRNWEARQAERAAQGPEVNPTQRTERRTSVRGPNLPQINRNPNSKPSAENRRVNVPTTKDQRAVEFFRKSVISKPKVNKEHYSSDTLGEDKDHEHSMARSELSAILNAAKRLRKKMNGEGNVEAWVQSKITRAADYLDSAADYIDSGEMKVNEERMTQSDVEKEKKLKNKYDDSKMKENFINQYGEEKGKKYYFAYIRKMAMKESFELNERKLSKTERRARNAGRKGFDEKGNYIGKGGIHAFDVDETIVSHGVKGRPNVNIHVKDESGNRVASLTNQEYNTFKLAPGHSYDYDEFDSAERFHATASPNRRVINKIRNLQKRGKRVALITARGKFDDPEEFRRYFTNLGIKLKPNQIHYAGGMGGMEGASIGEKKLKIAKALAKIGKTNSITMYDDAAKVHNAFRAERKRNRGLRRGLRIRTQLAKPNKQGDVMLRSYQAADFNLWVGGLLAEGYDLSEFTVDDLYEAYEVLLEELIAEEMDEHEPLFKSPYAQGVIYSNQIEEEIEQTPYDFWKSFIFESENMDEENEDDEIEEEISFDTPYDAWKSYFSEKYIKEEDGQDEEGGSSFTTNITSQQIAQERIRRQRRRKLEMDAQSVADRIASED